MHSLPGYRECYTGLCTDRLDCLPWAATWSIRWTHKKRSSICNEVFSIPESHSYRGIFVLYQYYTNISTLLQQLIIRTQTKNTMSIKSATEYLVQAGDTFWSIGQKLSMSVGALEAANPGVSAESLHVGQILHLPAGGSSSEKSHQYTVISGDTLWAIAQKFGVPVAALEAANPSITATQLQPGQVIVIPAGGIQSNPSMEDGYINYSGRASAFPDPSQWASYADLWAQNSRLMKFHDSDSEISQIKSAIQIVSKESGVDERVILCIIVQESGGNVRIPTVSILLHVPIKHPCMLTPDRLATLSATLG